MAYDLTEKKIFHTNILQAVGYALEHALQDYIPGVETMSSPKQKEPDKSESNKNSDHKQRGGARKMISMYI